MLSSPAGAAPSGVPGDVPSFGPGSEPVVTPKPAAPPPAQYPVVVPKPPHSTATELTPSAWSVYLTPSNPDPRPGQAVTMTAYANQDVLGTGLWISVYELPSSAGAGGLRAKCGTGTQCGVTITRNVAVEVRFKAYISLEPTSDDPPSGVQAEYPAPGTAGGLVRWQWGQLTVVADNATIPLGVPTKVTATTDSDVGPTPYWIEIYDTTTGGLVRACGGGSSCPVDLGPGSGAHGYVGYIARYSSTLPPTESQVTPRTAWVTWTSSDWRAWLTIELQGDNFVNLRAHASRDVGPTPQWISIYDTVTGARICRTGGGTTCDGTYFGPNEPSHPSLVAFISSWSDTYPPPDIQASSQVIQLDFPGNIG